MLDRTHFADVSSYLTFKLSAWKRGCIISFELQMSHRLNQPHFRKLLQYSTKDSKNWNPFNNSHDFHLLLSCSTIFILRSVITPLCLSSYINVLYHTINTCDPIYLRIITHEHTVLFKKTPRFCGINIIFCN